MLNRLTFVLCLIASQALSQTGVRPLDADLNGYTYPFPVHFLRINTQLQEYKMAYMDVQPTSPNGKSVMLLHGKNFNGAYWGETARTLAAAGYRVIIPDQIGFGKSSKPEHYQFSFHQLARNTKTLLDSIGASKVSVVGHSMGGMVATRFTLMYPQTVDKLILVNPIGLEDWKLKTPYVPIEKRYEAELKLNYESIKKYQLENYYDGKWKPEYDEWVNVLAGWTLHKDYKIVAWNAALTHDMIFTQPVLYEFGEIKVPTLLIIGQRDRTAIGKEAVSEDVRKTMGLYPELGRETQRRIPRAQLVELENVGHMPHIEAFDRFIKPLVEMLRK